MPNFFSIFTVNKQGLTEKLDAIISDKLTEIFCIANDFYKEFEQEIKNTK
jgi:hypothetical protein